MSFSSCTTRLELLNVEEDSSLVTILITKDASLQALWTTSITLLPFGAFIFQTELLILVPRPTACPTIYLMLAGRVARLALFAQPALALLWLHTELLENRRRQSRHQRTTSITSHHVSRQWREVEL